MSEIITALESCKEFTRVPVEKRRILPQSAHSQVVGECRWLVLNYAGSEDGSRRKFTSPISFRLSPRLDSALQVINGFELKVPHFIARFCAAPTHRAMDKIRFILVQRRKLLLKIRRIKIEVGGAGEVARCKLFRRAHIKDNDVRLFGEDLFSLVRVYVLRSACLDFGDRGPFVLCKKRRGRAKGYREESEKGKSFH